MSRLPQLDRATLDGEAARVYDEIAAAHDGLVRGPWAIELRVPELAALSHAMYERICVNTTYGKGRFELMVIVVARHWTSQFMFWAHERLALENGVGRDVTEAVRERRRPTFANDGDALIYDLTTEINQTRTLGPESYARGVAALGEAATVEFVVGVGYYTMLAMQLNVFDADLPADARKLA